MDRLSALIVYFVANSSHNLGRTELVKHIYTFEYYHTLSYGKQYTEAVFQRHHHGPYCATAINTARELVGIIAEDSYLGRHGIGYSYRIEPSFKACEEYLPEKQKELADFITSVFKGKSFQDMLDFVYSTPPMVKVLQEEKDDGFSHHEEVLDMSTRKPSLRFTRQELRAAKERNQQRKKLGTDNEYTENLLVEHRSLGIIRRRANQCLEILK